VFEALSHLLRVLDLARTLLLLRRRRLLLRLPKWHLEARLSRQQTSAYVSIRQHTSAYAFQNGTLKPVFLRHAASVNSPGTQLLRCEYVYFCTSKASKLSTRRRRPPLQRGKKNRVPGAAAPLSCPASSHTRPGKQRLRCQYLYSCTSKASKVSTWQQ
jgi:hypothetical protein